jgi:hypothetical protein
MFAKIPGAAGCRFSGGDLYAAAEETAIRVESIRFGAK